VISHHNKIYKKPYKNQKKIKIKNQKTPKKSLQVNSEKQKQKKYIYTLR